MDNLTDAADQVLRDATLERLRRLVELESPSHDEARLRAVAAEFAAQLSDLGAGVRTVDAPGVGEHVEARIDGSEAGLDPVLVIGHLDTVHPVGTFDPVFRVADGRAEGPGVFDMKGGWACLIEALGRLTQSGSSPRRPVWILATCDEETGSATSRELIEARSRAAAAVLVLEPAFGDGAAKTSRKGVGWYRLSARGRAAHAGLEPDRGINATVELARQILAVARLGDPERETTVTPTRLGGGTAPNVVPAEATVHVDVRFVTPAEGERVDAAMRGLEPVTEGARLSLEGGINRPPMERTPEGAALYERARRLAAADGWVLAERRSGGASDGSFAAALGVPTLDGLGPVGGGAHARSEHVRVDDIARRVRLYGRLLTTL